MSELYHTCLADRGIIRVAGADAAVLLDGLITNSLGRIAQHGAIHAGLLSPQGKILFDFFVVRDGDDLLIDTARSGAGDLIKRLSFYRLRADVTFVDETAGDQGPGLAVAAAWGQSDVRFPGGFIAYRDPRHHGLGYRLILPVERRDELPGAAARESDYHDHRVGVGVPDAGRDYELGNTFPHEALYDQLASVDFKKGCYVGQEVVSRMQHRGTARKRIVPVIADQALETEARVTAGAAAIGKLGSASRSRGLALIRLDRAHEAATNGIDLKAGNVVVKIQKPEWMTLDLATGKPEANA